MKNSIPVPILKRIWALAICAICVLIIGTLWSLVYQDSMMLMLTITAVLTVGVKAVSLYRGAKHKEYDTFSGVILSRRILPLQKKQEVVILSETKEETIVLAGKTPLQIGEQYHLYVDRQHVGMQDLTLAPQFLPGRSLWGYEYMGSSTGAKK